MRCHSFWVEVVPFRPPISSSLHPRPPLVEELARECKHSSHIHLIVATSVALTSTSMLLLLLLLLPPQSSVGQSPDGETAPTEDALDALAAIKDDCVSADFVCPTNRGSYADPCTCRRFFKCDHGHPNAQLCPAGLFWDDLNKICEFRNRAVCGPINATTANRAGQQEAENLGTLLGAADDINAASPCDVDACRLPDCFCSPTGDEAPFSDVDQIPQFILLMLDGAINVNNFKFIRNINDATVRKSNSSLVHRHPVVTGVAADKAVIPFTIFLKHEYTNYHMLERLYVDGHEIALMGISDAPVGGRANASEWAHHMASQLDILDRYAHIPADDVLGYRATKTKPGRNAQYEALAQLRLIWDSSIEVKLDDSRSPIWPYSLDHAIAHECRTPNTCPTHAFPGLWEVPLNAHYGSDLSSGHCLYLDQCVFAYQSPDDIFEWLKADFARFTAANRAPYTMPFHTNWFLYDDQVEALNRFILWTLETQPDVRYVTVTDLLLWLTDATPQRAADFRRDASLTASRALTCAKPHSCEMVHDAFAVAGASELRYMSTCAVCPAKYPWLL